MIYIVGAGGLGREMMLAIEGEGRFLDDDKHLRGRQLAGAKVVGAIEDVVAGGVAYIGIGDPKVRESICERLTKADLQPKKPLAAGRFLRGDVRRGTFLAHGSVVTVDVRIGQHVAVLNNAVVGHDSVVGDYSVICPGAIVSGRCRIGKRVFIGAGAVIMPDAAVGDDAIIGAGAVVLRDVEAGRTVVGNPARVIK